MVKYLIPRQGVLLRDIISKEPLPEKGAWKPWVGKEGRHWRRSVNCGDCYIGNPPKPEKIEKIEEEEHKMSRKGRDK